ncbi:MAG: Gfo/Idh/MocA family oxidoreductase [Clostridia bacterium]|nr:Gfo/Idh/MocA family oxidoreductase [Eubacteriales bacterium]MDD4462527.1 Gfo/Idh/MocA family oxidoreductase [Eubacteriales bacterium]NCC48793.1 Gfo/Idh/MocA family oxidoreductase [Clostridia bacterium]
MSQVIRIVLAGIGGYGENYVRSLISREQKGDPLRLVAVVDPAADRSPVDHLVADRPCFADLSTCLDQYPADLVLICSPIQYHMEQINAALDHGAHVLCEKPMCATLNEALQLIGRQQQSGKQVGIGYQWSYSPAILRAKADVLAGRYGDAQVLRTRVYWPRSQAYYDRNHWAGHLYSSDGRPVFDSVLNNATAHYLHNMLFFLGSTLNEAAIPEKIESRLLRAFDIETFDTALLRMEKSSQAGPVTLALAVSHSPDRTLDPSLDYRYSKGRLTVEDYRLRGYRTVSDPSTDSEIVEEIDYGPIIGSDQVADKVDALLESVRQGTPPVCGLLTASAHTAVVATVHQQSETLVLQPPQYQLIQNDQGTWRVVPGLADLMDRFIDTLELPASLADALRDPASGQ